MQNPGSDILVKIIRGTNCSAEWLMLGKGEKYPIRQNMDRPGGLSGKVIRAYELLDLIESQKDELLKDERSPDIGIQLIELGLQILKHNPSE